jgi:hypothetical protein
MSTSEFVKAVGYHGVSNFYLSAEV